MTPICLNCQNEIIGRDSRAKFCFLCMGKTPLRNGGARASYKLNKAIKKGLIKPAKDFDCVDCGKKATCYDHRDYNKPFNVEPVCSSCNKKRGSAIPYNNKKSVNIV